MTTSVSGGVGKLVWIMLCLLPLYSVGRVLWLDRRSNPEPTETDKLEKISEKRMDRARELLLALFVLFMLGLLTLTFENGMDIGQHGNLIRRAKERLQSGLGINFIPFHTIRAFIKYSSGWGGVMINIVGNIVMFLPWGLGLPLFWKKYRSFMQLALMSLMLPVCIEFVQLFIGRSVDIDDVILNFTGAMLGGLVYMILSKLFPRLGSLGR
ncbi:MAG: VanZ family protein [Butyrivibrio sp.]|nr:VanZ family protein [Muribaculum sp.]MCM1552067.1 VanZ family protein [Butyrivibrio sp.]